MPGGQNKSVQEKYLLHFLRCLLRLLLISINVIFQEVQVFVVVSFTHVIFLYQYTQSILSRGEEKMSSPNKHAGVEIFVLDFTSTEQYGTGRVESLAGLWLPRREKGLIEVQNHFRDKKQSFFFSSS